MRTTTFSVVMVTLAALAVSSGCIKKEDKEEDNKAGPPPAPAPPPAPPPEPARSALAIDQNAKYTIVAAASGKCVQFGGRGMNDQAVAEIATCDKSPAQQFKLQPVPGNYWTFVSVLSGKCLDVQAVSHDDGVLVQQFTCNAGPNQQWIIADAAPGTVRLTARHSGKVLDVKGAATADGTPIIQWGWRASAADEQFKLTSTAGEPSVAAKGGPTTGTAGTAGKKAKPSKTKTP